MPVPTVMNARHADGQLGIGDHHLRHHQRVEDHLLGVGRLVGDHAGAADLGAGAGGGRHGDDRGDALGIGAGPPVADVLEIPHRPRLAGHEGDDLAGIEPRAAAEGDDAVMAAARAAPRCRRRHWPRSGSASRRRTRAASTPASLRMPSAFCVTGRFASPASVTSSGFVMPAALSASGSSAMRPAPKRTAVG